MKQLMKMKKNQVLLFCIIVMVISEVLKKVPTGLLDYFGISNRSTNAGYLVLELIVLTVAVFMVVVTAQGHVLKFSAKGFAKSMLSGVVVLALSIFGCISFIKEGINSGVTYKSISEIIAFVLFVITVGLAEEFLYRGIVADCIFERFGNSRKGVIGAVVLSGCLFGAIHLVNMFAGKSFEEAIIQMIATGMLGILLSTIYIKHKSVYGVAVLHGAIDFMTMFRQGFWAGNTLQFQNQDINFWESLKQSLTSQSVYIVIALFVLRPSVIRKIVEAKKK